MGKHLLLAMEDINVNVPSGAFFVDWIDISVLFDEHFEPFVLRDRLQL